jgi:hypothetical protein
MQAAALATKQAARDLAPEPDREDRRPTLCLFIGPESGDPLVNWRLIPRRGYVRQYRAVDAMSGDPVVIDGELIGGGRDRIVREAIKMLPKYRAVD